MRAKLSLVAIFTTIAAAVVLAGLPAAAESTWDQIKRTGKLRYGAVDYPPNWYRDKTSGKWTDSWSRWSRTSPRRWGSKLSLWRRLGRPAFSTCSPIKPTFSSDCKQRPNGHW